MRKVMGVIIAVGGVLAAIYVGVVIFAVGGIERVVDGFNDSTANGSKIAWGLVQFWSSDIAAFIVGAAFVALGWYIGIGTFPLWISRWRRRRRRRQREAMRHRSGMPVQPRRRKYI